MFNPFLKSNVPMYAPDNGGEGGGESGKTDTTNTDTTNTDANKGDKGKNDNFIPKERFDEVNNKFKEMKTQFDAMMIAKEAEETEAKKKTGQFEDLYTKAKTELDKTNADVTTSKGRVEALEGVINSMLEAKIATIPEEFRGLVPDGMAPEQKLAWLAQAEAKGLFGATKKAETPLGGSTNPTGKQTTDTSKMSAMDLLKAGYSSK